MLFINEIQYFEQNIRNIKFHKYSINCGLTNIKKYQNIQMYPLYESSCSFSFSFFSSNFNNGRSGTREEMEDKAERKFEKLESVIKC